MELPPIKVHNTLTGKLEPFEPIDPPHVRMYVCGITPYSTSHFGHGMSVVVFDTIRRYLGYRGYQVRYVQNFTDIEDRIINRSNETGISAAKLTERYTTEYFASIQALNVLPAYVYPRPTEELPEIVEMITALVEKGFAYEVDGDVYFEVARFPTYGKLSRQKLADLVAGARVEVDERKRSPADFALWKAAKPGEPTWPSPWSDGRPGWHIECSVMSSRYLGDQIDVHGGGQDLIFPHHENEIAQSEAATGKSPFVRYWIHNGFVLFGDEKMSKSLGNTVSLPESLRRYDAVAVRLFIQQSHYRSPLSLSEDGFEAATRGVERLQGALEGYSPDGEAGTSAAADRAREGFVQAMDDDFNTPGAIAAIFDLAREANRQRESGNEGELRAAQAALAELTGVLGLRLQGGAAAASDGLGAEPFVQLLIEIRKELRGAKQFALADKVRDELTALGVALEDRPEGTTWRRAGPVG